MWRNGADQRCCGRHQGGGMEFGSSSVVVYIVGNIAYIGLKGAKANISAK
jgi:hypothetical protein